MLDKEKVLFSIILPTYNREKKIVNAIQSVLDQTYKSWELIIIDNNSTDNTKKIVEQFKNDNLFFYQLDNNGIIAKSRNLGINKAKGEYICFLDSDDWWESNKLKRVYRSIIDGKTFIYHDHYVLNKKRLLKKRKITSRKLKEPIYQDLINYGPYFATSSVTVHKDYFIEAGCFKEDQKYIAWEDFDAWLSFSKISNKFHRIAEPLSTILIDGENMLDNNLKIKNTYLFLDKYLENEKNIPNWCLYNLLTSYFEIKNFKDVKLIIKKINFKTLSIFQKINFIRIFFKTNFFSNFSISSE